MKVSIVSQSEFARRCGKSRQAVNKAIKAGNVIKAGEEIDLAQPTNAQYLARSLAEQVKGGTVAGAVLKKKPEQSPKATVRAAAGKKPAQEKPTSTKGAAGRGAGKTESNSKEDEQSKAEKVRGLLESAGLQEAGFDVDDMVAVIMQKSYWDTMKVKEDVLKRQLDRAREVGSVIDQRIIESEVGAFGQAIVANFVDSPQKQAIQICQMLGAEGKERQVTEYLEKDNARRLEECDRAVKKIAARLRGAGRKRRAAA